jgi:hypothetical protein
VGHPLAHVRVRRRGGTNGPTVRRGREFRGLVGDGLPYGLPVWFRVRQGRVDLVGNRQQQVDQIVGVDVRRAPARFEFRLHGCGYVADGICKLRHGSSPICR